MNEKRQPKLAYQHLNQVLDHSDQLTNLSGLDRHILSVMAYRLRKNKSETFDFSQEHLSNLTGYNKTTTARSLSRLVEHGYLSRHRKAKQHPFTYSMATLCPPNCEAANHRFSDQAETETHPQGSSVLMMSRATTNAPKSEASLNFVDEQSTHETHFVDEESTHLKKNLKEIKGGGASLSENLEKALTKLRAKSDLTDTQKQVLAQDGDKTLTRAKHLLNAKEAKGDPVKAPEAWLFAVMNGEHPEQLLEDHLPATQGETKPRAITREQYERENGAGSFDLLTEATKEQLTKQSLAEGAAKKQAEAQAVAEAARALTQKTQRLAEIYATENGLIAWSDLTPEWQAWLNKRVSPSRPLIEGEYRYAANKQAQGYTLDPQSPAMLKAIHPGHPDYEELNPSPFVALEPALTA